MAAVNSFFSTDLRLSPDCPCAGDTCASGEMWDEASQSCAPDGEEGPPGEPGLEEGAGTAGASECFRCSGDTSQVGIYQIMDRSGNLIGCPFNLNKWASDCEYALCDTGGPSATAQYSAEGVGGFLCPSAAPICAGETYNPETQQCCDETILCSPSETCVSASSSISGNAYCGECSSDYDMNSTECAEKYTGDAADGAGFSCIGHVCGVNGAYSGSCGESKQGAGDCVGVCFYNDDSGSSNIGIISKACEFFSGNVCGCPSLAQ